MRSTISLPASVSPPFSMPCAEPPNSLSKKWVGDIIRKPASNSDVDVGRVVVERVGALDGQQPGGQRPDRRRAPRTVLGEVGAACGRR